MSAPHPKWLSRNTRRLVLAVLASFIVCEAIPFAFYAAHQLISGETFNRSTLADLLCIGGAFGLFVGFLGLFARWVAAGNE